MLFIKIYQNNNDKLPGCYGKYYGKVVTLDTMETDDLCTAIEEKCTVHTADVKAVLTALKKVVATNLQNGYRVHLEGLGYLKLSVGTQGVAEAKDFTLPGCIKKTRVIFQPEKSLVNHSYVNPLTQGVKFRDVSALSEIMGGNSESGSGGTSGGNNGGSGTDPIEDRP